MKINRSKTHYVKLPESLQTASLQEAKCQVSLNLTIPKEFKKSDKFMEEAQDAIQKAFKKYVKKEIEKLDDDE